MLRFLSITLMCCLCFCAAVLRAQPPEGAVYKKTTQYQDLHRSKPKEWVAVEYFDAEDKVLLRENFAADTLFERIEYAYDEAGGLSSMRVSDGAGNELRKVFYVNSYDAEGRPVQVITFPEGKNRVISYHEGGSLESTYMGNTLQYRANFDAEGHMTGEYKPGVNISRAISYDEHGEISEIRTNYEEGHEIWRFRNIYDEAGRLIKVFRNGMPEGSMVYDEEGRLIEERSYGGEDVHFVYSYTYTRL